MKYSLVTILSLLVAVSASAQIVFQDAFDGSVPSYDSPNDSGATVDSSDAFSPIYYDGNDASVVPGTWQHTGGNFSGDLTIQQSKGKARAAAIVLTGSFSGTYQVTFDLNILNNEDTLYVGVYDALNSNGNTTNAYGLDVLANLAPGAPTVTTAVASGGFTDWGSKSPGLWGPMQLGDASVSQLAMYSVGGAADNSGVLGAQSFNFTAGANDLMIFIGVTSVDSGGMNGTIDNLAITAVPEPSTFALLTGLGGLAMVLYRRRRS